MKLLFQVKVKLFLMRKKNMFLGMQLVKKLVKYKLIVLKKKRYLYLKIGSYILIENIYY